MRAHLGCGGGQAILADDHAHRDQAILAHAAAFDDGGAVGGQDDIAVQQQPPSLFVRNQLWPIRRQADGAAVDRHHGLGHAAVLGQLGMFFHVAAFAVHRDGDFGPDPFVHGFQFRLTGVAGNVHMGLFFSDDVDAARGQRVLDAADAEFIAGDLLGGIDDEIARLQTQLGVAAFGDAAERRHRFALRARAQDQNLVARQAHRRVPIDGFGQVFQIASGAGDTDDAVHRAAGQHKLAATGLGNGTQRAEAGGVAGKGRHQHAAGFARFHDAHQAIAHIGFAAGGFGVEDVGAVSDQRQDAAVADGGQLRGRSRRAHLRRIIQLPVAGVEDAAIGRIDDERVAFGDGVGKRDIGETERAQLERAAHGDDLELHLVLQPFFLQLLRNQAGGERGGIERHLQFSGEIGDGADMIFMAVGEHDAEQILAALLDEGEIGQHHVDAGIARVTKGHAEIDHHPFALAAIEIDVHANLAGAA